MMVSIYAFFGSFLANNTAPTMAVSNNIEDISKGSRKSLNNTLPKLDTNPISGFFSTTGSDTSKRRNVIIIMMSVELMLNSVNLLLTAFSVHHGDPAGQVFVFFVMALAAAEVAVGLAIIVMVYRNTRSVDINALNRLRG